MPSSLGTQELGSLSGSQMAVLSAILGAGEQMAYAARDELWDRADAIAAQPGLDGWDRWAAADAARQSEQDTADELRVLAAEVSGG